MQAVVRMLSSPRPAALKAPFERMSMALAERAAGVFNSATGGDNGQ
jgi:hypothetical protein